MSVLNNLLVNVHQSILSASQNPFFIQLKNFITTALKVNLRFTNRLKAVTLEEYQAHVDIFDNIKAKDSQAAFDGAMVTQRATLALINEQTDQFENKADN